MEGRDLSCSELTSTPLGLASLIAPLVIIECHLLNQVIDLIICHVHQDAICCCIYDKSQQLGDYIVGS